jgi:signal transduction histidine kinase
MSLMTALTADLSAWPGIVLGIAPDGSVRASNGKLESAIGADVTGRPFVDLLDAESSRRKWERMLASPESARWELVLRGPTRLLEPRAFSLARSSDDDVVWLIEHPADARLEQMAHQLETMNAELATVQRALFKEQARLAAALKELERSNAALDEFAYAASHDLKTPLRAIADYAELLSTGTTGERLDEEERGYLARMTVLATKMRGMIDAVLQFARAGRASGHVERVSTAEVLGDIVAFLAPPADVEIVISPQLPTLRVQRVPFEQVFRNLLSNAIKYRREGGARIEVSARDLGVVWEFTVADNGPGISPTQRERIWRLFHTTRPADGSGIGLALVKRLVEAQGGQVRVESTAGEGSQFHVRWPKEPPGTTAIDGDAGY